jgi:hypothetical protein
MVHTQLPPGLMPSLVAATAPVASFLAQALLHDTTEPLWQLQWQTDQPSKQQQPAGALHASLLHTALITCSHLKRRSTVCWLSTDARTDTKGENPGAHNSCCSRICRNLPYESNRHARQAYSLIHAWCGSCVCVTTYSGWAHDGPMVGPCLAHGGRVMTVRMPAHAV